MTATILPLELIETWSHSILSPVQRENIDHTFEETGPEQAWRRYRICKEAVDYWAVRVGKRSYRDMLAFWVAQLSHAYTNLPVEALRVRGGWWRKKLWGMKKDNAYIVGHIINWFLPAHVSINMGRNIKR